MDMKFNLISLTLMILLSACGTISSLQDEELWQSGPPKSSEFNFHAEGNLSLRQENRGIHALFDWQNNIQRFARIDIQSPLGNTLGSLCRDQQGYIVEDAAHHRYLAKDSTDLAHRLLGYDIPLQYLDWWLLGYVAPDAPYEIQGKVLIQHGWRINRLLDAQGHPHQLIIQSNQTEIILLLRDFSPQDRNLTLSCQL